MSDGWSTVLGQVLPVLLLALAGLMLFIFGIARLAFSREVTVELRGLRGHAQREGIDAALAELDAAVVRLEESLAHVLEHGTAYDHHASRVAHGIDHPGALRRALRVKAEARGRFVREPAVAAAPTSRIEDEG